MSHPQSDSPVSPISVGDSSDSQSSPTSTDSSGSPAIAGLLGPAGRITAVPYFGASTPAVALPDPARRPYPGPHPAGSAVSASLALHAVLKDSEEDTLMETLGVEMVTRDAHWTEIRIPVDRAQQVVEILHGDATAVLIEAAAPAAARADAPDDAVPVGAELTVSHLCSMSQGWVRAIAAPLRRDRHAVVYQAMVTDDDECTIAVGTLYSLLT